MEDKFKNFSCLTLNSLFIIWLNRLYKKQQWPRRVKQILALENSIVDYLQQI